MLGCFKSVCLEDAEPLSAFFIFKPDRSLSAPECGKEHQNACLSQQSERVCGTRCKRRLRASERRASGRGGINKEAGQRRRFAERFRLSRFSSSGCLSLCTSEAVISIIYASQTDVLQHAWILRQGFVPTHRYPSNITKRRLQKGAILSC